MTNRITPEEIAGLRASIRQRLAAGQQEAARTGQPLAILIGEAHHDYRSFLSASLVVDEAQKLGIRTLNIETDTLHTPHPSRSIPAANLSPLETMGSLFPGMRTRAIDTGRAGLSTDTSAQSIAHRDAAMAQNIAKTQSGTVSLVGALHLQGIAQHPSLATSTVVAFNAVPPAMAINTQGTPHLDASISHARTHPSVTQLTTRGDAREHSYGEVVGLALGARATPLLSKLEQRGLVTSASGLDKLIAQHSQTPPEKRDAFAQLSITNAHRDLAALRPNTHHAQDAAQGLNRLYTDAPSPYTAMRAHNAPTEIRSQLGVAEPARSIGDTIRGLFSGFNFPVSAPSESAPPAPTPPRAPSARER